MKHFKIFNVSATETWYVYLYSCRSREEELVDNGEEIKLDIKVLNNGSHFEENDNLLTGYIVLFVVWIGMVVRFAMPIASMLSFRNPDSVKVIVYGGMVILGMAYLYRLIHLGMFWHDGSGVHLFEGFYYVLKNIGEAVITTMLISIAWGWTIVHLRPNQYYIIVGAVSCLVNIISLILASLTEEH